MSSIACAECPDLFAPKNSRQKFCSDACRYSARDRARMFPCAHCGEPMHRGSDVVPGVSVHNACSPLFERDSVHGTPGAYRNGCRCDACRGAKASRQREFADRFRSVHGVSPSVMQARKFRQEHGFWPKAGSTDWIEPKLRHELYERDGWTCHLCGEQIDRDADKNTDFAPSLDHLLPRSQGGSDGPSNLLTAHRLRNSVRRDAPLAL